MRSCAAVFVFAIIQVAFGSSTYGATGTHVQVHVGSVHTATGIEVNPSTDKRAVDLSVGTWTFFGQTPDQLSSMFDLHSARPITIRAEDPSLPTFSGSMVANSGAYNSPWWWYYGFSGTDLATRLDSKTLISLDPYQNSNGLVFVAIMIPNVGPQAISWWWWYGFDVSGINDHLTSNNARLISARPYLSGSQVVYAVIMVSNVVDPKNWQWLTGQSIAGLTTAMNNNQQRLLSLALNPSGGWDAVLVATSGESWWWWTDVDATGVTNNVNAHSSLLVDLTTYLVSGARLYAGIELGDGSTNSTSSSLPSTQSAFGSSIPSSSSPLPTTNVSVHPSTTTRTRIIIIGSVCGGIAVVFMALILAVLLCRGRNGTKTNGKSRHVTHSTKAPSSLSFPTGVSTATSNTVTSGPQTSGQSVAQPVLQSGAEPVNQAVTQLVESSFLQPDSQPSREAGPSMPRPSSYKYGYVPPTDAIFNVIQGSHTNSDTNGGISAPPAMPQL